MTSTFILGQDNLCSTENSVFRASFPPLKDIPSRKYPPLKLPPLNFTESNLPNIKKIQTLIYLIFPFKKAQNLYFCPLTYINDTSILPTSFTPKSADLENQNKLCLCPQSCINCTEENLTVEIYLQKVVNFLLKFDYHPLFIIIIF